MKSFLKKNLMIVVSIALPLLVVILFALASVLPGLYSTPPLYDLLLTHESRATSTQAPVRYSVTVQDERVKVTVIKLEDALYRNNPRIFRYDHLTDEVEEISISIPEDTEALTEGVEIPVPELAGLKISDKLKAPDGYEFRGRRMGGGLIVELFGGNRNRHDVSIAKDGAVVRIRLPADGYRYNNVRLVGWVVN